MSWLDQVQLDAEQEWRPQISETGEKDSRRKSRKARDREAGASACKGETLTQAEVQAWRRKGCAGVSWLASPLVAWRCWGPQVPAPHACTRDCGTPLVQGLGDRALRRGEPRRDQPGSSFLPCEGGGSCQRKWGHIKEGRKGQGQVRRGHRPDFSLQSPPHPG